MKNNLLDNNGQVTNIEKCSDNDTDEAFVPFKIIQHGFASPSLRPIVYM